MKRGSGAKTDTVGEVDNQVGDFDFADLEFAVEPAVGGT